MTAWKFGRSYPVVLAGLLLICRIAVADGPDNAKKIRIALYADDGASKESSPQVKQALPADKGFEIILVTAEEIRRGALDKFDVVIQPGGSGSAQAARLGAEGCKRIKSFVEQGGGYIGICAGAYLASAEYPWSLNLLDAHVLDRAHWDRGQGNVKLKLSPTGKSALATNTEACDIHFENGPLLGPGNNDQIDDYEPLADYETEVTQNAPPGLMKGTTAIARGHFGKGRVVCFSPHPEKTPGREPFLQAAVRWVVGLATKVGQSVILRGRFDGPGNIADYIITDSQVVYLTGNSDPSANTTRYGTEVTVRGKLQRYRAIGGDKSPAKNDEPPAAIVPTHYFIESAKLVTSDLQE